MEPPYQSSQSQAQNCRTTFPFHLTYHSDFASPSLVQSELQPYILQAPSPVLSEAQDHSQLYSQFSVVESQCQSQGLLFQAHQQAQSQCQPVKKGAPNKTWKPHYDDFLIAFLVEQANQGMKIDKTFKRQALEVAATALNHQFNESFTWENVENHMRAWKTKYQEIKRCKDLWTTAWNDDYKMIALDKATYEMYIEANPKAKDYINKPIENYEALKTIFGDEQGMGYYKKSIFQQFGTRQPATYSKNNDKGSINLDEETEPATVGLACSKKRRPTNLDGSSEAPQQESTKTSSSRKSRASGKRPRENIQTAIMKVAQRVDDVATTMKDAHPASWTSELHEKIMDLDDFETSTKEAAFEALRQDEAEARAFVVKNTMMRISWMKRFIAKQQSDQA